MRRDRLDIEQSLADQASPEGIGMNYKGKHAVVVGCASGMGAAVTAMLLERGAQVTGYDIKQPDVAPTTFSVLDLKDPAAIDAAAAAITGKVDALFYCAGLPQTFPAMDVMKVNFISMRHLVNAFVPLMAQGSAIAVITSMGGMNWHDRLALHNELLATASYDEAVAWCEAHLDVIGQGYAYSKEAANVFVMVEAARLIGQGIRINATQPAPTDTPMMPDFERSTGADLVNVFTRPIGRRSTPAEQAGPLLFLNSDLASYVNGHLLNVDGGFYGALGTGRLDLQQLIAEATRK